MLTTTNTEGHMRMRVRGVLAALATGGLVACGGATQTDEAIRSALMRRALDCPNCQSPHRIEQDNDPSGCSVGETCNPPGGGGNTISCTNANTSHDGNTCNGRVNVVNVAE